MLRNVIAELHSYSLNGQPLIVKNTFVDVAEAEPCEPTHRRSKSLPWAHWRAGVPSQSDEQSTPDEPLHEVRRRVFTCCGDSETLEDFLGISPKSMVDLTSDGNCSRVGGKADNLDALEVNSDASTQIPCSSVGTRARFCSDATDNAIVRVPLSLESFLNSGLKAYPAVEPAAQDAGQKTTLMFRNLPVWFTRQNLEQLMNDEGFGMLYDFIYLPAELGSGTCFGYAFINMVTPKDAEQFVEYFQGFDRWPQADTRRAVVHLSEALQGLHEQTERYRNSPLMHPSVADELRPAVYSRGVRVPFPEPTAPIRPPRVRTSTKKKLPARPAAKTEF